MKSTPAVAQTYQEFDSEELTTIVELWNRKDVQPPVCLSRTLEDIVHCKQTETETVKQSQSRFSQQVVLILKNSLKQKLYITIKFTQV